MDEIPVFCDTSAQSTAAVPVTALRTHLRIRARGIDPYHVQRLATSYDRLPPLLVHRQTMTVIDGLHRLAVAQERGHTHVAVQFIEGGEFDLLALAVRANCLHGLPLSMEDRRAAVRRLLTLRPEWSDRRLGRATGVSPGLVSKMRSLDPETPPSGLRLGLDGKTRPMSAGEGRLRVAALLAEQAQAPVREVAAAAGVSVATAQDVRNRLSRGADPLPERVQRQLRQPDPDAEGAAEGAAEPEVSMRAPAVPAADGGTARRSVPVRPPRRADALLPPAPAAATRDDTQAGALAQFDERLTALRADPSVRSTEAGRELLRLLATHRMSVHALGRLVAILPAHRVETVAGLASSLAAAWSELARGLEQHRRPGLAEARAERRSKVS